MSNCSLWDRIFTCKKSKINSHWESCNFLLKLLWKTTIWSILLKLWGSYVKYPLKMDTRWSQFTSVCTFCTSSWTTYTPNISILLNICHWIMLHTPLFDRQCRSIPFSISATTIKYLSCTKKTAGKEFSFKITEISWSRWPCRQSKKPSLTDNRVPYVAVWRCFGQQVQNDIHQYLY